MVAHLVASGYRAQKTAHAIVAGAIMRIFHTLAKKDLELPAPSQRRALQRRFAALIEQDLDNVRAGHYPERVLFQTGFREALRVLPEGVFEMPRVILRARNNRYEDLPDLAHADRYPRYYRRNFHWQSDGWFSQRSARLYDPGVDMLFGGTADVMRRMIVPDVKRAVAHLPAPRILDVATGTGRSLAQLALARPDARFYGLDLSAPYLQHARATLGLSDLSLIHENAENMPFATGTFDAVTSVFLFHELPKDARRNVAAEAFRVLAPGATFTVLDSAQLDTASDIDFFLESFPKIYHEPYYKGYLRDPLPDLLREVGFEVDDDRTHFVSRAVVARKPPAPPASAPLADPA